MISALRSWLPSSTKIDLVAQAGRIEHLRGSPATERQVLLLVVHRHDDGQVDGAADLSSRGDAPGHGARGRQRARRGPLPFRDERLRKPKPVEHPRQGVVHEVIDLLGPVIEGGHGRQDHRPHLRQSREHAQVAQMQRALADHEDQRAAFLERHVRRARDERISQTVGNRRGRLDAARHDHHAIGLEGARTRAPRRCPCCVALGRQRLDVAGRVIGLLDDGPLDRRRDTIRCDLDPGQALAATRGSGCRT